MNINRRIARFIYLAQGASDDAKGIREIPDIPVFKNRYTAYAAKDKYIILAISEILRNKNTDFRFNVSRKPDQNGNMSFLIYFDFKIDGKREQVSFHSFNSELWKFCKKSRASTWSKDKSSRDTVVELLKSGVSARK